MGCGDKTEPSDGSGGSTSAKGGATGSGGAPSSGGSTPASGGSSNGTGGATGSAGSTSMGQGGAATGGSSAKGGATSSGGSASANGGSSSGGASRGGGGGTLASGGTTTTSGGSNSASGGGGNATGCTRELLKSTIDAYFKALAAHDPAGLPTASSVKFTENGKAMALGSGGLWKTAGSLKYSHSALDTEGCNSATQAVVPDGSMDIPLGLRLKLVNEQITEIETIAVRPGDYKASGQDFPSNTAQLASSATTIKWETPVPADQRNTRQELTAWMDKYFRMFPRGVCNTTTDCKRIENGGGNFSCSAGASCASGSPSGSPAMTPRLIFADEETGLGVGFTMFQNADTDMHLFKMYGGKVYGVSAILGAAGSSGWD